MGNILASVYIPILPYKFKKTLCGGYVVYVTLNILNKTSGRVNKEGVAKS